MIYLDVGGLSFRYWSCANCMVLLGLHGGVYSRVHPVLLSSSSFPSSFSYSLPLALPFLILFLFCFFFLFFALPRPRPTFLPFPLSFSFLFAFVCIFIFASGGRDNGNWLGEVFICMMNALACWQTQAVSSCELCRPGWSSHCFSLWLLTMCKFRKKKSWNGSTPVLSSPFFRLGRIIFLFHWATSRKRSPRNNTTMFAAAGPRACRCWSISEIVVCVKNAHVTCLAFVCIRLLVMGGSTEQTQSRPDRENLVLSWT